MRLLDRAQEFMMRCAGATRLDIDIQRLKRRIKRDEEVLRNPDLVLNYECCFDCCQGSQWYNDLREKQDRREAWLKVLLSRRAKRAFRPWNRF